MGLATLPLLIGMKPSVRSRLEFSVAAFPGMVVVVSKGWGIAFPNSHSPLGFHCLETDLRIPESSILSASPI